MRYRPHRGMLADAMAEAVDVPSRAALYRHVWATDGDGPIEIKPYSDEPDERIGWANTHIVLLNGVPVGFCEVLP